MEQILIDRFFTKFTPSEPTNCWTWLGYKDAKGYGIIKRLGKSYKAHRLSYSIHKGRIPDGLVVCHTCDNPSCVNPNHLWTGTHRENQLDCNNKNRRAKGIRHRSYLYPEQVPRGEASGMSKLSAGNVRFIKQNLKTHTQTYFAKMFNVNQTTIGMILRGKTWKHIT